MMMTVAQQPTWVAQTLFTHPAMLQRTGCLYFSVPGTQGLCLLFPLGLIPHIRAVSEALGVAGSWGRAVHCWGGFAAATAQLDADGHTEQPQQATDQTAGHRGPAGRFEGTVASVESSSE